MLPQENSENRINQTINHHTLSAVRYLKCSKTVPDFGTVHAEMPWLLTPKDEEVPK